MRDSKQDNEMVERLLAGLGAAPVVKGFGQRVTRAVEARTTAAEGRSDGWRGTRLVFASAMALLLCLVVAHNVRHQDVAIPGAKNAPLVLPAAAPHGIAPGNREAAAVEPFPPRRAVPLQHKANAIHEQPVTSAQTSFPSPEAPLTTQERLLLRIIHRGDPTEVAMLNPQELARKEDLEAAEFQRFFPPPAPPAKIVPDDSEEEKGDTP